MKARDKEAARLETDYIARVKETLSGRDASEIDEVIQSVKEHIEEELSDDLDGEVGLVQMANVLERLGPPEAYSQDDPEGKQPPVKSPEKPQISRLAIAGILGLPASFAAAALIYALGTAFGGKSNNAASAAAVMALATAIAGIVLSIIALIAIKNSKGLLKGKGLAYIGICLPIIVLVVTFLYWLRAGKSDPGEMDNTPMRLVDSPPTQDAQN